MIYIPHEAGVGKPLERGTRLWEIHSLIGPHPDESIIDGHSIHFIKQSSKGPWILKGLAGL